MRPDSEVRNKLRAGAKRIRTGDRDRLGFSGGIGEKGGLGDLVSLTWDVGFESALLQHYRRRFTTPRTGVPNDNLIRYRASTRDCGPCPLKPRCCPNALTRKVPRSIYEGARDLAREIAKTEAYRTSRRQRKKVEMLFAHLERILKLDRLRLRGPCGARDEFHLAATVQNLRKLAKLIPGPQPIPAT